MLEIKEAITVKGFKLENPDKIQRALHGSPNDKGMHIGGVLKEDGTFDGPALLAEYDRIGGLIRRGEDKVRTGSFYDFKNRRPFDEPQVAFEFRVNGELVIVPEGKMVPGVVKAAQVLEKEKKAKKAKK